MNHSTAVGRTVSVWTEDRVARLKALQKKGFSGAQIAGELGGVSRAAVIGKLHRMGIFGARLEIGVRVMAAKPVPRNKKPRGVAGSSAANIMRGIKNKIGRALEPMEPFVESGAPAKFLSIGFMELEKHHCRYPRGGDGAPTMYCGQAVHEGSSYCPSCYAVCWTRPPKHVPRRTFVRGRA